MQGIPIITAATNVRTNSLVESFIFSSPSKSE
jgi:hypothetical protein